MRKPNLPALFGATTALFLLSPPLFAQTIAPVLHLAFDEATGTNAADSSGNGNPAKLQSGAKFAPGLVGAHSLSLNGKALSLASIAKPVIDTTRSYTVTAWVKVNTTEGYQTFVSIDGARVSGFFLQLRGDSGRFAFTAIAEDKEVNGTFAASNSGPEPDVWHHLAGVFDAEKKTLSLYVNGVLQQTVSAKGVWKATGETVIGRGKFAGNPVDFVNGEIDDVRIYPAALPASEIKALVTPIYPSPLLKIQTDKIATKVSPKLYGLMTEEINYSYDGGLYAELIRNRVFLDNEKTPAHWSSVSRGVATGSITLDKTQPLNANLPVSLRVGTTLAGAEHEAGVSNSGYFGVPVKPNTTYKASFYARTLPTDERRPLSVLLQSEDGKTTYARADFPLTSTNWKQYRLELRTTGNFKPDAHARFVITTSRAGTFWLNLVSLFPPTYKNRPNGNRPDLMQKMAEMKPAFLRFPGGNYLEGDTIETRFKWKETLHSLTERPGHQGTWGYRSSDGIGLLEFLHWCEDLKMEPLLCVFAGYSLKGAYVPAGDNLKPFVQEALDEIEYCIGSVNTPWGAQRAKDGHPKPFPISYVEIGNEDGFDRSGSYDGRYAQFHDAIKANYPQLQLIATDPVKSRVPDLYDDHFYRSPEEMAGDSHHYDRLSRTGPKIFVGEWASQTGTPTPDLRSALGDAGWMTGMERNSDVVVLSAYAPLLVNVNPGGKQWNTNLIGYDGLTSFGSPSYYVHKMFRDNLGEGVLPATLTGASNLIYGVTRNAKMGKLFLKVVNFAADTQTLRIQLDGTRKVEAKGKVTLLTSANLSDVNTLANPTKVAPLVSSFVGASSNFEYRFLPYSVTVLELQTR